MTSINWKPDGPPFFKEDGSWRSVEAAATHAIIVQGGFTDPETEARRMLREPANRGTAEAWLDEHVPGWRD